MCGICGAIGYSNSGCINKMNQRMIHRGPDDVGIWGEDNVYLGHTRLSIIDISLAGHQPMSNEDGAVWITYNGEIYNFKILREKLESKGHKFKSDTDTEVIVHLYEEYEEDCLKYLRGMFSFAIWDKTKKRLFAARDRFGIKPFFYYSNENKFIFASELRAILTSGLVGKDINLNAVADYFTYGSVQAPQTMIKNIFQLLPGHCLIFENDRLTVKKYWGLNPQYRLSGYKSELTHIDEIRTLLNEAVKLRMISDVPMGAFLSGGIDSSTVVSLMQKSSSQPVKTFSIIFEDEAYDERKFSNTIAGIFGTNHRQILLREEDVLKEMPAIFDAMDQPSADGFNTFVISKAVKKAGLTVALSGLGGDELFAGYLFFKVLPKIANVLKITKHAPKNVRSELFRLLRRSITNKRGLKMLFSLLKCENLRDLYLLQRMVFLPEEVGEILNRQAGSTEMMPGTNKKIDSVNLISYLELTTYLQNTLLQDTDRMSMASSLEVRVPFLDHLLVEKMFEIPGRMKVGNDFPKRLLVKSMQDSLPKEIYNRPKMGFVLPFEHWLKNELKDYCQDRFLEINLKKIAVLNYKEVNKIWVHFLNGSKLYNYSSILTLLSFINWHDNNILK